MSFFAGSGKLHITKNARTAAELNTSTIYPDTTFHSDMNVICSLGEHVVQAYRANFIVRHGDFTDITFQEQCYEVELPNQVVNALSNQQVVLVQINTGDHEAPVNFPINIKTGVTGRTSSDDTDYSVAVAPQITVGGRYDVCFSYNSIKDRVISPTSAAVGKAGAFSGTTGVYNPSRKVMPWTLNPDFPSIYPNTMRAGSRFAQIHFLGDRWRLENTTTAPTATYKCRRDNPSMLALTQEAPSLVFIILNVTFKNGVFEVISPFPKVNNFEIKMQSGKITIGGKNLTSIKLLQTSNPDALGMFNLSNDLNRVLAADTYYNVDLKRTGALFYKKYDSFIFSQGARFVNGVPLFRPATGGYFYNKKYSLTNNGYSWGVDTVYYYPKMKFYPGNTMGGGQEAFTGAPINGVTSHTYPNMYYTDVDKLLMTIYTGEVNNASNSVASNFALIDTSKFTGLYVDKDGIKGTFGGKMIPIYNNASAPTYFVEVTRNAVNPTFTIVDEGSVTVTQDLVNISATRTRESLLVGVNVTGGKLFNSLITYPKITLYTGDKRIVSEDFACDLGYDATASTFGLLSLLDGGETILAHGYLDATLKFWDQEIGAGSGGGPSISYTATNSVYVAYITISLKRVGTGLQLVTRAVMEKDRYIYTNNSGAGYEAFVFKWLDAPQVRVAITKIQSSV